MRKTLLIPFFTLIGVLLLSVAPQGAAYAQKYTQQEKELSAQINKIAQTLFYIKNFYLDSLNVDDLVDKAMESLVQQLDPHSTYIPEKDLQAMNAPLAGNFSGIGIEFMILKDSLVVANTIPGGPSETVGIRANDRIVQVDGVEVSSSELTNQKVYDFLRGPKGTRVAIKVFRRGAPQLLDFEVVRDNIPIHSVDAAYLVDKDVMYVKISRFALNTKEEFMEAFRELKVKPSGIILDLQGNGGGYLGTAIFLADQFLQKGQRILYTEGDNMSRREERATGRGFFQDTPLVVLIDESSASASEIVSGAIQDWDRGVIVGRRSFGKGLVQQSMPLEDGSELRLTVARYHTPSGRVIQSPYKPGDKAAYYRDIYDRYARGEYFSADSIHVADSLAFKTLVEGRTVYGGGGIMPDVFVPADTTYLSPFYEELLRRGLVTEFMNNYMDTHRDALFAKYRKFEAFEANYNVPQALIDALCAYAVSKGVPEATPKDLEVSLEKLCVQIRALMASRLYDTACFYKIMNPSVPAFVQGIEQMQKLKEEQKRKQEPQRK